MDSREEIMKNRFEKVCQCPVCLDIIKDPRTLNCQHTFCKKCLESACLENQIGLMSLFCPTCRTRQPLIYQRSDVTHVTGSLFVNQVLELLREWNERISVISKDNKELITTDSPDKVNSRTIFNAKVTSFYEAINIDTQEHVQQLCVQEYGSRDEEIKRLEHEIRELKNNNTSLLMGNILLKMKNMGDDKSSEKIENKHTYKQGRYKKINSEKYTIQQQQLQQHQGLIYNMNKATLPCDNGANVNAEKNDIVKENTVTPQVILTEMNGVLYLNKEMGNNKDTGEKDETVEKDIPQLHNNEHKNLKYKSILCWRCFRTGHSGSKCEQLTTVRGRLICKVCNLVGHSASTCTA